MAEQPPATLWGRSEEEMTPLNNQSDSPTARWGEREFASTGVCFARGKWLLGR